jgi:hypothetical protein
MTLKCSYDRWIPAKIAQATKQLQMNFGMSYVRKELLFHLHLIIIGLMDSICIPFTVSEKNYLLNLIIYGLNDNCYVLNVRSIFPFFVLLFSFSVRFEYVCRAEPLMPVPVDL